MLCEGGVTAKTEFTAEDDHNDDGPYLNCASDSFLVILYSNDFVSSVDCTCTRVVILAPTPRLSGGPLLNVTTQCVWT